MGADISGRWISEAIELPDRLRETRPAALDEAVALCADAIGDGGLVLLFGTGHSRIPVEEMCLRYGSYPGFRPINELSTTFHTQVMMVAPPVHSSVPRLYDHADVVIDLCTPPGECSWWWTTWRAPLDGGRRSPRSPSSATISSDGPRHD